LVAECTLRLRQRRPLRRQSCPEPWHAGCVAFIKKRDDAMTDAIFLFTTLAFFALALAYARACAWL
jgi:hypothetical protein